jgi:hypothetical protein
MRLQSEPVLSVTLSTLAVYYSAFYICVVKCIHAFNNLSVVESTSWMPSAPITFASLPTQLLHCSQLASLAKNYSRYFHH